MSTKPKKMSAKQRKKLDKQIRDAMTSEGKAIENISARQMNLLDYADARAGEIKALQQSILSFGGVKRVFQTLPRHLRRRTMSHNIHRLPAKFRAAAQAETAGQPEPEGGKPKQNRHKRRRRENLLTDEAQSQREWKWTETHVWHAKRFEMSKLWGYKIAHRPYAKGMRPAFRASRDLATLCDVSYTNCVEMECSKDSVLAFLKSRTSLSEDGCTRALDGRFAIECLLYTSAASDRRLIAPVRVLTRHQQSDSSSSSSGAVLVWIWVHPVACEETLESLKQLGPSVRVESRKDEFNVFELTGPLSTKVLHDVLIPIAEEKSSGGGASSSRTADQVWQSLKGLPSPSSLPSGTIIGLTVEDPRISFPPSKTPKVTMDQTIHDDLVQNWPQGIASSHVWDTTIRKSVSTKMPLDKNINELKRKMKLAVYGAVAVSKTGKGTSSKGTKTENDSQDSDLSEGEEALASTGKTPKSRPLRAAERTAIDQLLKSSPSLVVPVPILLVQRSSPLQNGYGSGWDVIVPKRCGMPFWTSFVQAGARVIGLREHLHQRMEQGFPAFPRDFIDTTSYATDSQRAAQETLEWYYARPPGKRVNYEALRAPCPFLLRWDVVCGAKSEIYDTMTTGSQQRAVQALEDKKPKSAKRQKKMSNQEEEEETVAVTEPEKEIEISPVITNYQPAFSANYPPNADENPLANDSSSTFSFVNFDFKRGVPEEHAMVYLATREEVEHYLGNPNDYVEAQEPTKEPEISRSVIGFVTTGCYSLMRGKGYGMGFIASRALQQLDQISKEKRVVLVRNNNSRCYRFVEVSIPQAGQTVQEGADDESMTVE